MREMTKIEFVLFTISWGIKKIHMRLGSALGILKTETSPYMDGTRTVYKNRKGEILYVVNKF